MMRALYASYARLQPLPPHAVRWTSGFWAEWFATCCETMIPNMWRLLDDPEISHAYANFRIAAGLQEGDHRGPQWHDGDLYKWVEAASHVLGVTGDGELDRLLDGVVEVIGRAHRADLGRQGQLLAHSGPPGNTSSITSRANLAATSRAPQGEADDWQADG